MSTTGIVLAGGSLAGKWLGPSFPLTHHPAELADGSGFALDHITNRLQKQPEIDSIIVVVDAPLPTFRPMRQSHLWQWLPIPAQASVLASLEVALESIASEQVLVQPITTLPPDPLPGGCWIGLGDQPLPQEDWSAVSAGSTDNPYFQSKNQAAQFQSNESHPFTGLIAAPCDLLRVLLSQRHKLFKSRVETDQDLISLAELLWSSDCARMVNIPWLDLGHRATASRRRLSRLTSRDFNTVTYYSQTDLIRKYSHDQQRLEQEALYFKVLPQSLRRFFPALITHQNNFLELEYVPFHSLAELFLHWKIGANSWKQLIKRLHGIRSALATEQAKQPVPIAKVDWLYSQKLEQRLQQLHERPPQLPVEHSWKCWWQNPWQLEVVSKVDPKQSSLISLPEPSIATTDLLRQLPGMELAQPLQRIHGDLCFNNILAEPLSGSIRLIDPRGERPDCANWPIGYGDPRYDLVKLLHSSRYLYDVVVNDLFELKITAPGQLQLRLDVPAHYSEVHRSVEQIMIADQLSSEEERLLTASLFFSMLPLHREDGERCLVFTAIGLMILSKQFDAVLIAGGQDPIDR